MGKKLIFIFYFVIVSKISISQQEGIIRPGLIRTMLTISPAKMLSSSNSYFYLHGNLEAYLKNNLSFSGEAYFFQGVISNAKNEFNYNHSILFGFSKHFTKGNFDYYIGVQPGLSFTDISSPYTNIMKSTKMAVNPLFSTISGINYFIGNYFHFFVQTRLVLGQHVTDFSQNLADLRFSTGLGFNIKGLKK